MSGSGANPSQLTFWWILSFTEGLRWEWLWRLFVSKYQYQQCTINSV